jgi:hypothetical protein
VWWGNRDKGDGRDHPSESAQSTSVIAFKSVDGGFTWDYISTVADASKFTCVCHVVVAVASFVILSNVCHACPYNEYVIVQKSHMPSW